MILRQSLQRLHRTDVSLLELCYAFCNLKVRFLRKHTRLHALPHVTPGRRVTGSSCAFGCVLVSAQQALGGREAPLQVDAQAPGTLEARPGLARPCGAPVLLGRGWPVLRGGAGAAGRGRAAFVLPVVHGALVLLLGVAVGGRAPLGRILDPALRAADREAAFPSAFIGGGVGIEKVLAIASEFKKKNI